MAIHEEILQVLLAHPNESVSGSKLAAQLGVTRAAVWKAIEKLRCDGYPIHAVTNRGYCLDSDCNILSEPGIRRHLRTHTLGQSMHLFKVVESTNKTAQQLASDGAPNGTLVVSEQQTAGRGRLGRSFFSPPHSGVYMSVILRLDCDTNHALLLTAAAAVSVARALGTVFGVYAGIKWVNDVYLNGKKICGILTEGGLNLESQSLDYVIAGIGVNVSTSEFPAELQSVAASVTSESSDRCRLIAEILYELEQICDAFPKTEFMLEYRNRSILMHRDVWVIRGNSRFLAHVLDINADGHLVVQDEAGTIQSISSGEVSIRLT